MFRALFRIVLMLSLVTASGAWAAVSTQDRIKPEHGMEQTVLAAADVSLKHAAAMAKKKPWWQSCESGNKESWWTKGASYPAGQ